MCKIHFTEIGELFGRAMLRIAGFAGVGLVAAAIAACTTVSGPPATIVTDPIAHQAGHFWRADSRSADRHVCYTGIKVCETGVDSRQQTCRCIT